MKRFCVVLGVLGSGLLLSGMSGRAEVRAPEPFHYGTFATPADLQDFLWKYADAHHGSIASYDPELKQLSVTVIHNGRKWCRRNPDDDSCAIPVVPAAFKQQVHSVSLPRLFLMAALLQDMCRGSEERPVRKAACHFLNPVGEEMKLHGWCEGDVPGQAERWTACRNNNG